MSLSPNLRGFMIELDNLNMNRRHLLTHIGLGTIAFAGGCLESTNSARTATGTPRPQIDDQPCPPYAIDRDRAVCSHTVSPDSASVYLVADPQSSTVEDGTPVDDVTLTLYNKSANELRFNPHSWRIWQLTNGSWSELDQQEGGDGVVTVSTDSSYTWTFLEAVGSIRSDPELSQGIYAAEIGVPDPDTDGWVACIALSQFKTPE